MRGRMGLGAGAAIAALVAAVAVAGAALTNEKDRVTIAADEKGAAVAKCARGSEAVSGGFNAPGSDTGANSIYTYGSKRAGTRKVKALGSQQGPVESRLVAYAVCDDKKPGLTARTALAPAEDGDDVSVTARCPRGSEAVWGGFSNPDAPAEETPILNVGSSRKGSRKWTVSGVSFGGTDPLTLKAFVYCDRSEPGLEARSKSVRLDANESGTATAKCRRGDKAVAGGYLAPGGFSTGGGPEIYFRESHRVGKRKWTASGDNSGDPNAELTAVAYCK